MNEIIDQMVELYFLGGNIYEMLAKYRMKNLFEGIFKGWREFDDY